MPATERRIRRVHPQPAADTRTVAARLADELHAFVAARRLMRQCGDRLPCPQVLLEACAEAVALDAAH